MTKEVYPLLPSFLGVLQNITSRFSESAGRNGLHFQKLIREVLFAPVLTKQRNRPFVPLMLYRRSRVH